MKNKCFWLQCGGCGGDTMSLLNAHAPSLTEAMNYLDIQLCWHPSLSYQSPRTYDTMLTELRNGTRALDLLCVEGAAITGPAGTGRYETFMGTAKKDILIELAHQARFVIAVGTCASFGGVTAAGEVEATGLQFEQNKIGGLLGADFTSKEGLPVITIPGCPVHPAAFIGTLSLLLDSTDLELNDFNSPTEYFSMLVHQGCTRNEYHEYQVEETDFGQKGCLFFHLGCHGPLAHGPCNKYLWNNRSCKTRSGIPCFGCTEPGFPQDSAFFETPNIVGLPINLPDGVDRPHYLAYKGMAAAAAPARLKHRKTKI